jgi:hypothetical protein
MFSDNLGGTSIVINASGTVEETIDYYPYGGPRVDYKVGTYEGEKNKYAGTQYDTLSALNYMQAQHQSPTRTIYERRRRLVPAPSAIVSATTENQQYDEDDQKCSGIHGSLPAETKASSLARLKASAP